MMDYKRRAVLLNGLSAAALLATGCDRSSAELPQQANSTDLFKISLAQWSMHRAIFGDGPTAAYLKPLDFPVVARRDFDIDAVEYVNTFYTDQVGDQSFLKELKTRADGEGVTSVLIMCDGGGRLGDPDAAARKRAVEDHYKWAEMAAFLGCHAIRVNAVSEGSFEDQRKLAADGLRQLAEHTRQYEMSVVVENHGGLSSNGGWLAGVMEWTDHPYVGTLPDFGNFRISDSETYDLYKGVTELMPYAKGVSAKTFGFTVDGTEQGMDYYRLINIVLASGFRGYIGIEYEGSQVSESEGIRKTKVLLERLRKQLSVTYS